MTATDIDDMGTTYYWLEAKATKTVTRFADGGSATAERSVDGDIRSRLADIGGNELSSLSVDRVSTSKTELGFNTGGERINAQSRPDLVHTLDWANRQTHTLHKDRPREITELEWRGELLRSKETKTEPLEDQPLDVRTEFNNGVTAVTTRNPKDAKIRGLIRRPSFMTRVTANGAEVGVMRWYAAEKILAWDFPGLTKDVITEEALKSVGGWTFKPTMAWANVQGLAFYDFYRLMKTQGHVARNCGPRSPAGSLAELLAPTLSANEPGCDGMHYMDGSIYRPCCDTHDRCYETNGCSSRSWYWPFGSSWSCTFCNMGVVGCFLGSGGAYIEYQNYTF